MKHNRVAELVDGIIAALAVLSVCGAVWYGVRLVLEAMG